MSCQRSCINILLNVVYQWFGALKQDLREWSADDLSKMTKWDLKKIGYLMGLNLDMNKQKKFLVWEIQEVWDDTWAEQDRSKL